MTHDEQNAHKGPPTSEQREANGLLIDHLRKVNAELLAACEAAREAIEVAGPFVEGEADKLCATTLAALSAAIAKARGGSMSRKHGAL